MARICLITSGQPSSNPRLVKEADTLSEAGHRVTVIAAFWASWADAADSDWLSTRAWTCRYVGGHPRTRRFEYLLTRLRHGLAKKASRRFQVLRGSTAVAHSALSRTTPELISAAWEEPADLYIAHNLGALPAAVIAAERNASRAGFDLEDLYGRESSMMCGNDPEERLALQVEGQYLRKCDYLTASSPEIAAAYAARYGVDPPLAVLNAFPLHQQPVHRIGNSSKPLRLYWFSQTIGENRGLEDVVRAMGRMAGHDIELHLRGTWQPGYRDDLHALARQSAVPERNIIAHAPGLPDEMPRLAASFDIGLSTEQPLSENKDLCLGNKLFTYLLAGNAIVATATLAQSRFAETIAEACRVYAPGDVDALAEILRLWDSDRQFLERARQSAWQAGRDVYNWDLEKEKILERIEHVLKD
jgi:glycosyltransferase involved in cell wall biosynthesis